WQKLNGLLYDWEKQYEVERLEEGLDLGDRFIRILKAAHEKTGRRAVVLVDEYDKPVLDVLDVNKDLEEEHRNILKGF
ncbi:AAA family ATPase, partial [Bacteroides caecigallinarum]